MKDPFRQFGDSIRKRGALTRGKKLTRKRGNLTGVCAGLGDYFQIDPILIRAAFIGSSFFMLPFNVFAYLGLSVFLPKDEAESWGSFHYTYDEHEKFQHEQEVIQEKPSSRDSMEAFALSVCPNCDTVAKPKSKFCHKCGTML